MGAAGQPAWQPAVYQFGPVVLTALDRFQGGSFPRVVDGRPDRICPVEFICAGGGVAWRVNVHMHDHLVSCVVCDVSALR